MKRVFLKLSVTIISIIIVFTVLVILISHKKDPDYIMDFINKNPEKTSLVVKKNGKLTYSHNSYKQMNVASLFKIIIAIELVNQVKDKEVNINEKVNIKDIDRFNKIPKANSAYKKWKKEQVKNKKYVTIYEVTRGMIRYSSNPNTDYLINRLGEKNINKTAKKLSNNQHEKIHYINSDLAIPLSLKGKYNLSNKEVENKLINLKSKEYEKVRKEVENELYGNSSSKYLKNKNNFYPTEEEQKIWSYKTPKSTSIVYANILDNIDRYYESNKYNKLLENILTIKNDSNFSEKGKNGYTININTKAVTINKNKDKTTIVFLSNDLDNYENQTIQKNIDYFIEGILSEKYLLERK